MTWSHDDHRPAGDRAFDRDHEPGSGPSTRFPRRRGRPWSPRRGLPRILVGLVIALTALLVAGTLLQRDADDAGNADALATGAVTGPGADATERALTALAVQFANDYLTWDAAAPQIRSRALAAYLREGLDPMLGWDGSGKQIAVLVVPVAVDRVDDTLTRVTVAAEVTGDDAPRWIHLQVPVLTGAGGRYAVAGAPALVPAPPLPDATLPPAGEIDPEASAAATPTLSAFFAAFAAEEHTDVLGVTAPDAAIRGLGGTVALDRVQRVEVPRGGDARTAQVTVLWTDAATQSSFQQAYDVSLQRGASGWLVTAVQGGHARRSASTPGG